MARLVLNWIVARGCMRGRVVGLIALAGLMIKTFDGGFGLWGYSNFVEQ